MPDEPRLRIGGRDYLGWKTARITVSIETGSGSFELSVSEKWPQHPARREVKRGQRAEVLIGKDPLISGYVNEVRLELGPSSHGVTVRGRDAVGDLIDCAPDLADPSKQGPFLDGTMRGEYVNVSLLELARTLASPFGITVSAAPDVESAAGERFQKVSLSPGQRVFDLIEEHCRYRQILPVSDGLGGLLLTRAGTSRVATPLAEGENILSATATFSEAERFKTYIVKGQGVDLGLAGEQAGEALGYATDPEVGRHRPLLQQADQAVTLKGCQDRAGWEAITRAARGTNLQVVVVGWRQPSGELWPVNALIPVRSPTLGVNGEFLITEVSYTLPSSLVTLNLARPDAFKPAPAELPREDFLDGEIDE